MVNGKPTSLEQIYPIKSVDDIYQILNNINHFLARSNAQNKVNRALGQYVRLAREIHEYHASAIKKTRPPKIPPPAK